MHSKNVTDSLLEVGAILVSAAVSWTTSAWIIKRDERKLSPKMLERAYAPATFAASVFLFQQIAVLVHFICTRRSFVGFLLGVAWTLAAFVPAIVVDALIALVVPE